MIAAGVRLTTHIVVGRHAHTNLNCTIGHDVIIEDSATLYPGIHLGGCVIEEGATLGTGCVVLPNVRVGRGAVVGAGSAVVRDVAPDTTVVGTVARPTLRPRSAIREGRCPIRMRPPATDQDGCGRGGHSPGMPQRSLWPSSAAAVRPSTGYQTRGRARGPMVLGRLRRLSYGAQSDPRVSLPTGTGLGDPCTGISSSY